MYFREIRCEGHWLFFETEGSLPAKSFWKHWTNPFVSKAIPNGYISGVNELGRLLIRTSVCKPYGAKSIKGGEGQSNTAVVMLNIECDIRATCFDSIESSSGPRVLDPYKQHTTHCGIAFFVSI